MSLSVYFRRLIPHACLVGGGLLLAVAMVCTAVGLAGTGVPFGVRLGCGIAGALCYALGGWLFRAGKSIRGSTVWDKIVDDHRLPVLYLRAFKDDPIADRVPEMPTNALFAVTASEEEQLAEVFSRLGPFVAIGRPGEILPQLGAARMYVGDDEWQDVVSTLMASSQLVLFRATDTNGFWWEIERSARLLPVEKRLYLIPHDIDYDAFRARAERVLGVAFAPAPHSKRRWGSLRGLVYFRPDHTSEFLLPEAPLFRTRVRKPLVSMLQQMIRPVYEQLGVPWSPPPVNWLAYAPYLVFCVVLPLAGSVALCWKGEYATALVVLLIVAGFQGFIIALIALGRWVGGK